MRLHLLFGWFSLEVLNWLLVHYFTSINLIEARMRLRAQITLLSFFIGIFTILNGQDSWYGDTYPAGGIGYSPMYLALDSIPGSAMLSSMGLDPKEFNSPFVMQGGEGITQISGRWRIGGYAGIGTSQISALLPVVLYVNRDGVDGFQTPVLNAANEDTAMVYSGNFSPTIRARFTVALGAVLVEHAIPVFRDLEVSGGVLFGMGRASLNIETHTGTPSWDGSFNNMYGSHSSGSVYHEVDSVAALYDSQNSFLTPNTVSSNLSDLSTTFFNIQPYVAVKWQFLDRVGIRVSGGFNKGVIPGGGWKLNGQHPISDSPKAALQGVAIRTTLYFGF